MGGKVSEARDIEYKRDAYGIAYKDHGEFLADLSSFANANGGSRSSTIRRMAFGRVRLGSSQRPLDRGGTWLTATRSTSPRRGSGLTNSPAQAD
jgi:hypothetical protein